MGLVNCGCVCLFMCMCVCVCVVIWCVGMRSEISEADLSKVLPEEVEEEVRQAAEISMGTEVYRAHTVCTSGDSPGS